MPVSVSSKTQTFTNGTPNDAGPVDAEFVALFNNDSTLATYVNNLQNGTNEFTTAAASFSAGLKTDTITEYTTGVGITVNKKLLVTERINLARTDDPASLADGDAWINTTSDLLKVRLNGVTQTVVTADQQVSTSRGYIGGPLPEWTSNASVTFKTGLYGRNDANTGDIRLVSDIEVSLAVSGAAGTDSAEAADTWYHPWLIRKSSDGTTSVMFSTSITSPTLPSGYDQKCLLPYPWRNDGSSNIIPGRYVGTPPAPKFIYDVAFPNWNSTSGFTTSVVTNLTTTSGTFSGTTSAAAYVPTAMSDAMELVVAQNTGGSYFRKNGSSHAGINVETAGSGTTTMMTIPLLVDASGLFQVRQTGTRCNAAVSGFFVNKYNHGFA